MIVCPYCDHEVEIHGGRCPECKEYLHEVTDEDFAEDRETTGMSVNELIEHRFKCAKCQSNAGRVKEVSMTGAGLSKLLDIEHNHFLFVSCQNCGFVEVYDPNVLHGKKAGSVGTILDILFGN
ncbi:zinc ribbon domain-containing protein [Paenibacillus albus]|nr:zinc ribbon domain-containing protein [Paenibacillus albus]